MSGCRITALAVSVQLAAPFASAEEFEATKTEVAAWVGADRDSDGALTSEEFPAFVRAMARAGQSTAQTIRFFGAYETAFSIADADGNGRLTPNELRSADDAHRIKRESGR